VLIGIIRFKNRARHIVRANPPGRMNQELRNFGFRIGLALNVAGFIMFWRERGHFIWFSGIGSLNLTLAIIYPKGLTPLKKVMDLVILLLGRAVNIASLTVVFYLVFAPIGILLRLFKKDLLHEKINRDRASYWIKRRQGVFSRESYERMG